VDSRHFSWRRALLYRILHSLHFIPKKHKNCHFYAFFRNNKIFFLRTFCVFFSKNFEFCKILQFCQKQTIWTEIFNFVKTFSILSKNFNFVKKFNFVKIFSILSKIFQFCQNISILSKSLNFVKRF